MKILDRWNSWWNGSLPDSAEGDELAELRDQVVRLTHDVKHMDEDRRKVFRQHLGALNSISTAEGLIARQAEEIVELKARLAAADAQLNLVYGL